MPGVVGRTGQIKQYPSHPYPTQTPHHPTHPYPTQQQPTANSAALRLLEPLVGFCLQRHEGYWSYEFCYKRGIRQYHNVAVRDAKGACVFCVFGFGLRGEGCVARDVSHLYAHAHATTGRIVSKVESEYVIGREHPTYGETFKEEHHIVHGEVRNCGGGGVSVLAVVMVVVVRTTPSSSFSLGAR